MNYRGFSLLELLIVFSIIGLMTLITYPSYTHYLIKLRRTDGQTSLLELANSMEDYYAEHQSYEHATLGTNPKTDLLNSIYSSQGWYILAIKSQTEKNYSLEARAILAQAQTDKNCLTLTLNSEGLKNGGEKQCW